MLSALQQAKGKSAGIFWRSFNKGFRDDSPKLQGDGFFSHGQVPLFWNSVGSDEVFSLLQKSVIKTVSVSKELTGVVLH